MSGVCMQSKVSILSDPIFRLGIYGEASTTLLGHDFGGMNQFSIQRCGVDLNVVRLEPSQHVAQFIRVSDRSSSFPHESFSASIKMTKVEDSQSQAQVRSGGGLLGAMLNHHPICGATT